MNRQIRPVDVTTLSFPGFPTDLQAQMMTLMSVAKGISIITEKIYPELADQFDKGRKEHPDELLDKKSL